MADPPKGNPDTGGVGNTFGMYTGVCEKRFSEQNDAIKAVIASIQELDKIMNNGIVAKVTTMSRLVWILLASVLASTGVMMGFILELYNVFLRHMAK